MTLVILIALIMAFVLCARFLKILERAVDWLYFRFPPVEAPDQEDPEKEPDLKIPPLIRKKKVS